MTEHHTKVRVAAIQGASVLFDKNACVDKSCKLIQEAASNGANLILFPEAFIPGYPRGLTYGMVVGSRSTEGRKMWQLLWENAIEIPGPETELLGKAAKDAGVFLAMGVIERDSTINGATLYCSLIYIDQNGELTGVHRKLKPTGAERLIWGEGDGSGLITVPTEYGRIGGLICWENYMPLARMALYSKGVEIYLAPTADARDTWQATLQHIAMEGRCFVMGCNKYFDQDMLPQTMRNHPELARQPKIMSRGGSAIISPLGKVLSGPLYDQEGILYADLDRNELVRSKLDFDVVGHYARPDIFQLTVNESQQVSVKSFHS